MTTALKRTIIVLLVLVGLGIVMLVSLVTAHHERTAYAANDEPTSLPKMVVSDVAYKAPVGIGITSKKATAETIAELEKATTEVEVASELEAEAIAKVAEFENHEADWQSEDYTYGEIVYYEPVEETWRNDGYEDTNVSYEGGTYFNANVNGAWYSGADFMFNGGSGCDDGSGFSYTWYSENILPGGGLDIPGRHVDDEGYVVDGDGNICIASDDLEKGTVVSVPFGNGTAVLYDCGSGYGNLDVYTSW